MKAIFFLLFISVATAAPSKATIFRLEMNYGEKISNFEIRQVKSKYIATMVSGAVKREREMKKSDVDHILGKFRTEKARREGECPREKVSARIQAKTYSACMGSGTELSKKLVDLANLLSSSI